MIQKIVEWYRENSKFCGIMFFLFCIWLMMAFAAHQYNAPVIAMSDNLKANLLLNSQTCFDTRTRSREPFVPVDGDLVSIDMTQFCSQYRIYVAGSEIKYWGKRDPRDWDWPARWWMIGGVRDDYVRWYRLRGGYWVEEPYKPMRDWGK